MDSLSISKKNLIILLSVFVALILGIVAIFVVYNLTSDKQNAESIDKPFNITVSLGADAASSVDITWTTNASSRGSYVQYVKKLSEQDRAEQNDEDSTAFYHHFHTHINPGNAWNEFILCQ